VKRTDKIFITAVVTGALVAEVLILFYYFKPRVRYPPSAVPVLFEVKGKEAPLFSLPPDEEIERLKLAFKREKEFISRSIRKDEKFPFGDGKISASQIKESAELLLGIMEKAKSQKEFNRLIQENFFIFKARGEDSAGKVLFTGYYTPVVEGSFEKKGPYRFPLYLKPDDLKVADLGIFDPYLKGEKIFYRIDFSRGEIVPYWSTKEIVEEKVLEGRGLEFIYLKDELDRFVLMLEGSGKVVLESGDTLWVRYAATNGRPYTSVASLVLEEGIFGENLSLEKMREYFSRYPEKMRQYLLRNERFIFFSPDKSKSGAVGATGVLLTPGISVAVDRRIFPLGALAYIEYRDKKKGRWERRFVFCQDTGGGIKGPGRADIYFGEGKIAQENAAIKEWGCLYFLVKK